MAGYWLKFAAYQCNMRVASVIFTSANEVMFYPAFVCLFVCLSVCLSATSRKTTDQIFV